MPWGRRQKSNFRGYFVAKKLIYLPQLDGLRAIAVVVVIIFHSRPDWLPGGFVGVDVFFFLSGFLITQIVVKSLESGRFSYLDFIAGRIRRLLPAYVAMICACLLVAPLILLPGEFERLAETSLASLLFLSNVFFYLNLGYFDAAAEQQLLLHTWSLAVEWHFYLIFPFVLWLAYRLTGRVLPVLILLGSASLALNLALTPENAKFTFFMLPARAWELIAGGMLGMAYMNGKLIGREHGVWSAVGLMLLAVSVLYFDKNTVFPGAAAIVPILATGVIVFNTVRGERGLLTVALSSKMLVLIGQMSYSLYLWHWPVLLYARFYFGEHLTVPQVLLCWSVIVVLSYGSWRWVESALRGHRWWAGRWRAYLGAVAMAAPLSISAALVMLNDGYERRLPEPAIDLVTAVKWPDFGLCATDYKQDQYYDCVIGNGDAPASVLVWGDSHAQTLIWAINNITNSQKTNVRHVTKGGCPPIYYGVPISTNTDEEACLTAQKAAWQIVESDPALSTVLMAARWPLYESTSLTQVANQAKDRFSDQLHETVIQLLKRNLKVIVIDSLPEAGFDVANVLARKALLAQEPTVMFMDKRRPMKSLRFIADIQDENFSILNLNHILCDDGQCQLMKGDELLYFDDSHLARTGAIKLAPEIERAMLPGLVNMKATSRFGETE
jgi:peptidoglycan/LPS O-acetylase OafA/YrhL